MELINRLVKELGVTETQARGGAGLLFSQARGKLAADDFSRVAASVQGIDELTSETSHARASRTDGLGKLYSLLGTDTGAASHVVAGFLRLDMESALVGRFTRIILSFVESKGGRDIRALLEKSI